MLIGLSLVKTQQTEAFLAEVRAQGVEMFAQWCRGERDFTLIDEDMSDAAAYEECVKRAEYFAAQLRKGGATEERQSFLSDEDCQAFVKAFMKGSAQ